MKTCLYLLLMFFAIPCLAQDVFTTDTVYFDKHWRIGTVKNYRYFRLSNADSTTMTPHKLLKITDHYKNGQVQMEGYVSAADTSKEAGLYRFYDKKGRIKNLILYDYKVSGKYFDETASYLKDAEPCDAATADLYISFLKNGHIESIGFELPGDANNLCRCNHICTWKWYNQFNTDLVEAYDYKNGVLDGRYHYYCNGILRKEGYYRNGKKSGTWKTYDRSGNLKRTRTIGS